jgi:dTDP-4-amino-4,6-dideoxygalactose transaminase
MTPLVRQISDKYRAHCSADLHLLEKTLGESLSGGADVVTRYESELSAYFQADHAVAVSSGTAAIQTALAALGVGSGSSVVLTPTCPLCTVYPILALGATPIFCDTQNDSFGCDPDDLARILRECPQVKAVLDIPMWGYPTRLDLLREITSGRKIPLVLDLAHSHGTKLHGLDLNRYGEISCFSTHERKLVSTGEGGFLLTSDAELARRCRDFTRFGNLDGVTFGLNFKLSGLQATLGISRLGLLDEQLKRRKENADHFLAQLQAEAAVPLRPVDGGTPNYYALLLRLNFRNNRAFVKAMTQAGIPSDILRYNVVCLYEFPLLQAYRRPCPNAEVLLAAITTIPMHPGISPEDLHYMSAAINAYAESSLNG